MGVGTYVDNQGVETSYVIPDFEPAKIIFDGRKYGDHYHSMKVADGLTIQPGSCIVTHDTNERGELLWNFGLRDTGFHFGHNQTMEDFGTHTLSECKNLPWNGNPIEAPCGYGMCKLPANTWCEHRRCDRHCTYLYEKYSFQRCTSPAHWGADGLCVPARRFDAKTNTFCPGSHPP